MIAGVIVLVRRRSNTARTNVKQTLEKYQSAYASPSKTASATAIPADADEATLSALLRLGMLEDGLDDREKMFIFKWGRKNGLSTTRMQALFKQAKQGQGEIHAGDRNDLDLITCLAMVDGSLSARELSVLNAVARKTGLSAQDLREIIVGVETGTLAPA